MIAPEKEFFNKITDVSNVPFAMAVLNDKGEITEYGPYQVEFAHEIPHIPLYTTPQIKELSDAIKIIEELRVDADMNFKDYENTYADGWDDAFNEILSALYERDGIK